jgi:hypothetical protein
MGFDTYNYIAYQMAPSSNFLDSYYCRRTRHTADSYPNIFYIAEHKLSACHPESGLPFRSNHRSEDITPMYMAETPPIVIQGPITRARARQLHQQVSSFLSTHAYSCDDGMLSNDLIDYIVLRSFGDDHEVLGDQQGPGGKHVGRPNQDGGPIQLGFDYLATRSRVHSNHGPGCKRTPISMIHIFLES